MKLETFVGAVVVLVATHASAQSEKLYTSAVYQTNAVATSTDGRPIGYITPEQIAYGIQHRSLCIGPGKLAYSEGAEITLRNGVFTCESTFRANSSGGFTQIDLQWVKAN